MIQDHLEEEGQEKEEKEGEMWEEGGGGSGGVISIHNKQQKLPSLEVGR